METIPEENEVLEENEPITEVDKGDESDDSDGSLNSLELSELQNTLTKSFITLISSKIYKILVINGFIFVFFSMDNLSMDINK